ncbi:MAG: hypothetical protein CM1200mP16_05920 [Nitrospina sp.]|nr:MAG: hypothetical protein CM1200mP16_05920 [Nitrospina sp.]
MDLSRDFPRSPQQKIAGLVQLGRMIDKGRAYKEKKLADIFTHVLWIKLFSIFYVSMQMHLQKWRK